MYRKVKGSSDGTVGTVPVPTNLQIRYALTSGLNLELLASFLKRGQPLLGVAGQVNMHAGSHSCTVGTVLVRVRRTTATYQGSGSGPFSAGSGSGSSKSEPDPTGI